MVYKFDHPYAAGAMTEEKPTEQQSATSQAAGSEKLPQAEEIERQISEWKRQMRDERTQRLAPRSDATSANTTRADPSTVSSGWHETRVHRVRTQVPDPPVTEALPGDLDDGGAEPSTLEEYKRQIDALAFTSAPRAHFGRNERVSAAEGPGGARATALRRNATRKPQLPEKASVPAHTVNPRDVKYYAAHSVLAAYINRPPRAARAKPDRRAEKNVPTPNESRIAANQRATSSAFPTPSARNTGVARKEKNEPNLTSSATEHGAYDSSGSRWTRSAVLRSEATRRTLEMLTQQEEAEKRAMYNAAAVSSRGETTSAKLSDQPASDTSVSSADAKNTTQHVPFHERVKSDDGRPEERGPEGSSLWSRPARTLFNKDHDRSTFVAETPRWSVEPEHFTPFVVHSSRPVASATVGGTSRFRPNIHYRRDPELPMAAAASGRTEGRSTHDGSGWGSRWRSEITGSSTGQHQRPVSSMWDSWQAAPAQQRSQSWREEAPSAPHDRSPGERSRLGNWTVEEPSFLRADLFQGSSPRSGRQFTNNEEYSPQPRTVQPSPRPLWY